MFKFSVTDALLFLVVCRYQGVGRRLAANLNLFTVHTVERVLVELLTFYIPPGISLCVRRVEVPQRFTWNNTNTFIFEFMTILYYTMYHVKGS